VSKSMLMRFSKFGAILLLFISCVWLVSGETTVIVSVIDERGNPIPAAKVLTGWSRPIPNGQGWGEEQVGKAKESTNVDGVACLHVGGIGPIIVKHPDYYTDGKNDDAMRDLMPNPILALNRPEITVTLLKKLRPVPMYVRRIQADGIGRIPRFKEPCGFDLRRCDWIAPYGDGEVADFTVTGKLDYRGERQFDYTCLVAFASSTDGIQLVPRPFRNRVNKLRLPREAPAGGYINEWPKQGFLGDAPFTYASSDLESYPAGRRNYEDDNFIFRVRSTGDRSDPRGLYGKIHGSLSVQVLPWFPKPGQEMYLGLEFTYYLNPDGTNSLEWNGQILFGELPADERFTPEP
jgi:hypothetical protein